MKLFLCRTGCHVNAGRKHGRRCNVLNSHGIDVLRGCSGNVKLATESRLSGNLRDSGISCARHQHGCNEE